MGVNTRIEPSDVLFHSGKVARINANIRAIELSKQLAKENRNATPAEQKILLQFSGWGAVAQDIFNPQYDDYVRNFQGKKITSRGYYGKITERDYQPSDIIHGEDLQKYETWKENYGDKLHPVLGGILTDEEWKAAETSTMNAHYTSREVIDHGLWGVARRLGFEGGRVLEPAAGIGHILGLMPAEYVGRVQLQGVELDRLSGQILSQLYPKADIQVTGFEKAQGIPDNSVDLVISNFPFGQYPINDNAHPAYSGWSIHNYFFARSADALRPGGVIIAITSRYTMDSTKNGKTRELLADKADLVAAIRLPNNAFGKNAGTVVTTDIIILRKKTVDAYPDRNAWRTNATVKINDATDVSINEYFVQHPEMVLGKHSMEGTMYGGKKEYTLAADNSRPLTEQLEEAVARLPQGIYGAAENAVTVATIERAEQGTKDGTFVLNDGKISYVNNGVLVAPEWSKERKKVLQAASYISVRDMAGDLIRTMQQEDASAEDVADLQRKLNRDYDLYRSKYGPFHERGSAYLADDVEFPLALALENEASKPVSYQIREGKNKGETRIRNQKIYTKADIFTKRTLFPFVEPTTAENIEDAVNLSLTFKNHISPEYIAKLLGKDKDAIQVELLDKGLAFLDPADGLLESRSEYLSGNVREKLRIAEEQGLTKNAEALRAVQPTDLTIDEIFFRLGSEWIPADVISGFMVEKMDAKGATAELTKVKSGEDEVSRWTVTDTSRWNRNSPTYTVWGAEGVPGTGLVEDCLNLHRTEIYDYVPGEDGKDKRVKNPAKSLNAQQKQREIQKEFKDYVLNHPQHAATMAVVYNREKNNYVVRQYDVPGIEHYPHASHLITLRAHQKGAVSRGLQGSTIFAHAVGTGKTYMYATLAMELKRTGQANKPLIVVQGSTVNQFAGQAKKLYPAARILCPSKKDRTKNERRTLLARIATNDYDMIIIPHSFFDDLNVNPARETAFIQEQLEEIKAAILELGGNPDKPSRSDPPTVKQLQAMLARKQARLDALKDSAHGIDTVYFDEMGIDAVLVDEAHHYKRGDFSTKMGNVKGLDRGAAAKSFRFLMKARAIQEKTRGKNIYLATGTPVSNTTAELWTLLRYVRPDLLAEFGAGHFDGFATMFGDTSIKLEQTETGDFKQVERFNKYVNGPELIKMWQTASDVILQEDVPGWAAMVPKLKTGEIQSVSLPRTQGLAEEIERIKEERAEWDALTGMEKKELSYVPLLLFNRAKQAAIDLRLVRSDAVDDPNSKTNRAVKEIYNRWEESREILGTQLVFADTYRGPNGFNLYDDIKKKLVGMGIPETEIANITENKFTSDAAKEALFEKVNQGLVRVMIGSTAKLGIGVNVQERLVALHHIDAPMRPMDFEQRNGRILRPGNTNQEVEILAYGVINTLDSVTYNRLQDKQKFINQLLRGKIQGRSFEDPADELQFTFEDLMAALSGNPLVKKRFELENKIREIATLEDGYKRKVGNLRTQIHYTENELDQYRGYLDEAEKEKAEAEKTFPDNQYKYHIAGTTYADPKDGKKALQAAIEKAEDHVKKAYEQLVAELKKREENPTNEDRLARSLRKDKDWTIPDGWSQQVTDIKEEISAQINGKELKIAITVRPTDQGYRSMDRHIKQAQQLKEYQLEYGYQVDPHEVTFTNTFGDKKTRTDTLAEQNELHGGLDGILTSMRHILKGISEHPAELAERIAKHQKNLDSMKTEIKKPFEFTDTLAGLQAEYERVLAELGAVHAAPVGDETETGEAFARPDYDTLDMPHTLNGEEVEPGEPPQYAMGAKKTLGPDEIGSLVRGLARTVKGLAVEERGGEFFIRTKGGAEVRIEGVNRIDADTVSLSLGYGEKAQNGREAVGEFRSAETTGRTAEIRLVRGKAGQWTINHEFYHFLEAIGAISNEDKNLLNRKIRSLAAKDPAYARLKGMSPAEQRAEWTGRTLAGVYDAATPTGKIIQKIKDVIDQVLNALGVRTAGGVVRDIREGKIYGKSALPGTREYAKRFAVTEKRGTANIPAKEIPVAEAVDFSKDETWHDIAYANPTEESLSRLKGWLKDNSSTTVRMYHGTNATFPVEVEGLKPTRMKTAKSLQSRHGVVSLSIYPGQAHDFGKMAYPGKDVQVYAVDVPVNRLIPDADQLKNKRYWGENKDIGSTLADSIAWGHGAQVKGAIPTEWIRKVDEKGNLLPNPSRPPEVGGQPQYALADRAEQAAASVTGAAARVGNRGLAMMGARTSPAVREGATAFAKHWKEFWQPFSTVADGDKILAKRYEAMGNVARAVRFIDETYKKLDAYPDQVKKDLFWYLNGDIPLETLPEEAQETAKMIRRRTDVIGEMLVDRGILAEGQYEKYKGHYIHYMYAKHVLGEDKPVFLTSTGKLNLSYTKSRNPKLTLQQRKELGLIEDASVAVPVGMGKALTDIAKWDYLDSISDNPDWVWQPSIIRVPIGKQLTTPIHGRTRRWVKMGIGRLVEETKIYDKMMAEHGTPEVAEIHRILHEALDKAEEDSQNMPGDFVQLPTSKGYGPLAGAYVKAPIASDLMPVLDIATDRGKLMNTILEIERQGMATFKMGKVALNFPTAFRNVVSNIIQNNMRGRSLAKIPGDIIRACESMKAKDAHYEEAFGMGLFHTNWFVSEINDVLDEFRKVKAGRIDQLLIALKNVAKYYGKIDDINKLAIFIEQRKAGKTIDEATLEAMKWGMDYSLTSRSIKGLRQTIMPFATYQYKIAPLIAESLRKRPWVLAKYGLIYTAAKMIAMGLNDLDDDDWADLEKQLPAYIKKSGSMMILPWKSDKGQWQWVNLEYFFPWGNYLAIARDMKTADLGEGLRDAGISNPFLSMFYTGLSTREDQPPLHAYFGTPIYNELDTAPVKMAKMLEYMANTWMPSMATRQGAAGYAVKAATGEEDRWGRTVSPGQALGRWFGMNIVSVSPQQTRAQASVRIQDLRKEMARIDANPSYDEKEKEAFRARLNERLALVAEEAPAAVLPITKAKGHDPVYDALQAMAAKGNLHTGPPSRSVSIAGVPYKMTMAQYEEYLDRSSEIARKKLSGLVTSPAWTAMMDKRKAEVVSGIMEHARKGIRQKIKREIQIANREKVKNS